MAIGSVEVVTASVSGLQVEAAARCACGRADCGCGGGHPGDDRDGLGGREQPDIGRPHGGRDLEEPVRVGLCSRRRVHLVASACESAWPACCRGWVSVRPVAALVHDPSLDIDSDVVRGLAASSLTLLENARLVEELGAVALASRRHSRTMSDAVSSRIFTTGPATAGDNPDQSPARPDETHERNLATRLEAIGVEAEAAVEELRTFAHGIYPPLLRDRGLADALRDVAVRSPIAVRVTDDGIGRCPAPMRRQSILLARSDPERDQARGWRCEGERDART